MKTKKTVKALIASFGLPGVVYFFFAIFRPASFLTGFSTIYIILNQAISTALLAWGMGAEMTLGTLDFSVAAEMILYEILATLVYAKFGFWGMILMTIGIAVIFGIIKAFIKDLIAIHSMVLGLGLTYIIGSLGAIIATDRVTNIDTNGNMLSLFPYNFILLIGAGTVMWFLRSKTVYGAHVHAVGGEPMISASAGINERKIDFKASFCGSMYACLAALFSLSRGGGVMPKTGLDSMLTGFSAIMCIFISVSLSKFVNSTVGILVGAVTMNILGMGLISIGLDSEFNNTVTSGFLLALIVVSMVTSKRAAEKTRREVADAKFSKAEISKT